MNLLPTFLGNMRVFQLQLALLTLIVMGLWLTSDAANISPNSQGDADHEAKIRRRRELKSPIDFETMSNHTKHTVILEYMDYLKDMYPKQVRLYNFGKSSVLKEDLTAIHITSPHDGKQKRKPTIIIQGAIHGQEIFAASSIVYGMHYILEMPKEDQILLDKMDWVLYPVANPDAYLTRHNLMKYTNKAAACGANYNMDLNCQFDYLFQKSCLCGDRPYHTDEAKAIRNMLLEFQDTTIFYLDIHEYGMTFLHASNEANAAPESYPKLLHVAKACNQSLREHAGKNISFAMGRDNGLGSNANYAFNKLGIPIVFKLYVPNFTTDDMDEITHDLKIRHPLYWGCYRDMAYESYLLEGKKDSSAVLPLFTSVQNLNALLIFLISYLII